MLYLYNRSVQEYSTLNVRLRTEHSELDTGEKWPLRKVSPVFSRLIVRTMVYRRKSWPGGSIFQRRPFQPGNEGNGNHIPCKSHAWHRFYKRMPRLSRSLFILTILPQASLRATSHPVPGSKKTA